MCLRDRIRLDETKKHHGLNGKPRKEICRRFNKGTCTAGLSCKFDHRCEKCGKFGHGKHICRSNKHSLPGPTTTAQESNAAVK